MDAAVGMSGIRTKASAGDHCATAHADAVATGNVGRP
jgi:hypothetical protein